MCNTVILYENFGVHIYRIKIGILNSKILLFEPFYHFFLKKTNSWGVCLSLKCLKKWTSKFSRTRDTVKYIRVHSSTLKNPNSNFYKNLLKQPHAESLSLFKTTLIDDAIWNFFHYLNRLNNIRNTFYSFKIDASKFSNKINYVFSFSFIQIKKNIDFII